MSPTLDPMPRNPIKRQSYLPYRFLLALLLMSTQTVWACLPLSSDTVFIGRVQSAVPIINAENEPKRFKWQFSHHHFVFRTLRT